MKEYKFQRDLKREIKFRFPGCFIFKQDSNQLQGIPDLLILYKDKWAMLECKRSKNAARRPNQKYYVDIFNKMSFASFVYPENKEQVLYLLQEVFK